MFKFKYTILFLVLIMFSVWLSICTVDYIKLEPEIQKENMIKFQVKNDQVSAVTVAINTKFYYPFTSKGVLNESGDMPSSGSGYWWLNSGGQFFVLDGTGSTVQGDLAINNKWRTLYSKANPEDTDNGLHPQNIFRFLTRSKWKDFNQEIYFYVTKDNLSTSTNRNSSNGLLLFNRYVDSDNLYYTGIRVDGSVIIKKKTAGIYYTMYQKPLYASTTTQYNKDTNPNVIPKNTWIGIHSKVKTNTNGTVSISVFIDKDRSKKWILAAEAIDDGKTFGSEPILQAGYGGIRTDFMDVKFDDYLMSNL